MELSVAGTLTAAPTGAVSGTTDRLQTGANGLSQILTEYSFGTGDGNAKEWYSASRTLAAGANDDLDLYGGLTGPLGATLNFVKVKELLVVIDSPDGTKSLRVGPQNVTNGWQGPYGGTGATVYETVYDKTWKSNPYGWTVTSGTGDILRINNPGAGSVTYRVFIAGTV